MGWDGFQREVLAALGLTLYEATRERDGRMPAGARERAIPDAPGGTPPLLQAIARAAGVDTSALPPLPPLEGLRSPAAKRALWPTLRALRRASRR